MKTMIKCSLAACYFPFLNCLWHGYCWMLWNVNNAKVVNSAFPAPWQRWWMETSVQGLSDSLPSHSSCFQHSAGPNVLQSPANPLLNLSMSAPHKTEENLEGKGSEECSFPAVGILAQVVQISGVLRPACDMGQTWARAPGTVQLLWCVHLLHFTLKSLTWQMLNYSPSLPFRLYK